MNIERINWTPHALQRLRERPAVTAQMVEEAIKAPHEMAADPGTPARWVAHRLNEQAGRPRLLRVFYDELTPGTATVVSFYLTAQVARYWRGGP